MLLSDTILDCMGKDTCEKAGNRSGDDVIVMMVLVLCKLVLICRCVACLRSGTSAQNLERKACNLLLSGIENLHQGFAFPAVGLE